MSKTFDVEKALKAWEKSCPDEEERIAALRRELADCNDERAVRGRGIDKREYPWTAFNIERMLAKLERLQE